MPGIYTLPSTVPIGWAAKEIVLICWTLDITVPTVRFDSYKPTAYPNPSGVYTSEYLNAIGRPDYLTNISSFASDVSSGAAPPPGEIPYQDDGIGVWEFAIENPCYIVFLLEQQATSWQFWRGSSALMMNTLPDGRYFDLNYILPNAPSPSATNNAAGCKVAYFSADVDTMTGSSPTDKFALDIQYWSGGLQGLSYDPAIKNKGHQGLQTHPTIPLIKAVRPQE
jgi:hypothetical protein